MQAISVWAPSVAIGVLSATMSAAMTNMMGASRVLLAVSRDKVFGRVLSPFAKTTSSGNPIPAVLMSFVLTVVNIVPSEIHENLPDIRTSVFCLRYFFEIFFV